MTAISDIIGRLSASPCSFRIVEGAAGLATAEARPLATPAAFVAIGEEASSDNARATGPILQMTEADLLVVIVTDHQADIPLGAAGADLEALKGEVRAKLIGYLPTDAAEPMTHVSGKLVKARDGTVWFEDVFSLTRQLEEQP